MNKQTKNGNINRVDYTKGNYTQISKTILLNKELSDSGLRLLQLIIDTPTSTNISLTYYQTILGWSNTKRTAAVKNLKDNGYLTISKIKKNNTYNYFYTVSEYGDLIQDEVEAKEIVKEVKTVVVKEVKIKTIVEPIQPEIVQQIEETEVETEEEEIIERMFNVEEEETFFFSEYQQETINDILFIMSNPWPMKTDVERKLTILLTKTHTDDQIKKILNNIYDNKLSSEKITELITELLTANIQ